MSGSEGLAGDLRLNDAGGPDGFLRDDDDDDDPGDFMGEFGAVSGVDCSSVVLEDDAREGEDDDFLAAAGAFLDFLGPEVKKLLIFPLIDVPFFFFAGAALLLPPLALAALLFVIFSVLITISVVEVLGVIFYVHTRCSRTQSWRGGRDYPATPILQLIRANNNAVGLDSTIVATVI